MASSSKLRLKLYVDKNSKKVLFAEAGKDVIDFLFDLLALPLATVIKLLSKAEMVGTLGNLYDSVDNLSDAYILPHQNKTRFLNPLAPTSVSNICFRLIGGESNGRSFYRCDSRHSYVTDDYCSPCPECRSQMSNRLQYVFPRTTKASAPVVVVNAGEGFVKGVVTYMVMDDLTVIPMSTNSLLTQLRVTDSASVEEMDVEMAQPEGLKLLKASLQCSTVLTSVFLGKGSFPDSNNVDGNGKEKPAVQ